MKPQRNLKENFSLCVCGGGGEGEAIRTKRKLVVKDKERRSSLSCSIVKDFCKLTQECE